MEVRTKLNNKRMKYTLSALHELFYEELAKLKDEVGEITDDGIYLLKNSGSVTRVLGHDNNGVLYIGQGQIFSNTGSRVGKLINAINGTDDKHVGGVRYRNHLLNKFPLENLLVEIEFMKNSREGEIILLSKYLNEFGELPPLNRLS